MPRRLVDRSLRTRLLVSGTLVLTSVIVALGVLGASNERMRLDLTTATRSILDEQQIANRIIGGVMQQLVAVATMEDRADSVFRPDFDAAGAIVYNGLQSYLFRDLSGDERHQLEQVKEEHQRMEVAAVRMTHAPDRLALRSALALHSTDLLNAMNGFLRMREANLQALADRQEQTILGLRVAGGGLLLLFGTVGAWLSLRFVRRRVTDPLAQLADAADRIGHGELTTRVPAGHDREFHSLAIAFNSMSERLARAQGALASRNDELEVALEQVRATQAELVQSEKLGAVGRMTAGLAHELNNPLASVLGYGEMLAAHLRERGATAPEELADRFVSPLVREATRARLLVRSLLHFSRRAAPEIGPVCLQSALDVVIGLRRGAFEQAGLHLEAEPVPGLLVIAEQQRLQAVFLNICNNALHAMRGRKDGTLRITVVESVDFIDVHCEDDGPGITSPERVFEPFYTTKEAGEGTGLGLALSRRFVMDFGGGIQASNRDQGGARFTVRLRRADPDAQVSSLVADQGALPAAHHGETTVPRRCVLVVEDEPELRRLSALMLARLDVEVLLAGDVPAAREVLNSREVDLIVSDVKMPGESGIDFYSWIRVQRPAMTSRFLFVTGDLTMPELGEFAAEHPMAVIHKPFEVQDYLQRVRSMLA